MLHNPQWDKQNTIFKGLVPWLERQPPEKSYNYTNSAGCLLFQYLDYMGVEIEYINSIYYYLKSNTDKGYPYPTVMNEIAYGDGSDEGYTFGAALERAKELL